MKNFEKDISEEICILVYLIREFVNPINNDKKLDFSYRWDDTISQNIRSGTLLDLIISILQLIPYLYPPKSNQSWCSEMGARKMLALARCIEQGEFPALKQHDITDLRKGYIPKSYFYYLRKLAIDENEEIIEQDYFPQTKPFCRGLFGRWTQRSSYNDKLNMCDISKIIHLFLKDDKDFFKNPFAWDDFLHSYLSPESREYIAIRMIADVRDYFPSEANSGEWCNQKGRELLVRLAHYFTNNNLQLPNDKEIRQLREGYLPEKYESIIDDLIDSISSEKDEACSNDFIGKVKFGILSCGVHLRMGWAWKGTRARGKYKFRLAWRLKKLARFSVIDF